MGAWIETSVESGRERRFDRSHPVWVRGLKHCLYMNTCCSHKVAPRVGAWIETKDFYFVHAVNRASHPVWVRGLKRKKTLAAQKKEEAGRTPCGCVD